MSRRRTILSLDANLNHINPSVTKSNERRSKRYSEEEEKQRMKGERLWDHSGEKIQWRMKSLVNEATDRYAIN